MDPPVQLCQASCFELPLADKSMDALVATRFIHQFPHDLKKAFYQELRRVVRPGGVIAVEFYARPYALLHYLLPRRVVWWRKSDAPQNAPAEQYFSHYPTRAEVREIVGPTFSRLPVRPAFCRLLFQVFGAKGTWALTQALHYDPLGILYSEYVAVSQA
jgi:ubiquinone/menaquinone biosynthesis C-methylase UbiE